MLYPDANAACGFPTPSRQPKREGAKKVPSWSKLSAVLKHLILSQDNSTPHITTIMVPQPPLPPTHHHPSLTRPLPPSTAQELLHTYLESSTTQPHLHPDSQLNTSGPSFAATSSSSGGLAIHHLRRIEAGLRGERLVAETKEELERLFGDAAGTVAGADDDGRLDASIAEAAAQKRAEGKGKRKRDREEEIEAWAHDTSSMAGGATGQELESFANTPMHAPDHGYEEQEWQDREEYEKQQGMLEGELGERIGATNVKQNGEVPEIVKHDGEGKTEAEKKARKENKKRQKLEQRRLRAQQAGRAGSAG
ncbi:uncharacterized protein LTR77_002304 [Saxophila tyrrhenica]|uniref:Uncharacterized protein n=1 Tax=Saxophila tyrrhenica TaxID=1690608 RepID=A0AAV9PLM1_9PEZI|nr:hypothetical protein LTR77_002304 [Saxophila tyrrhenica]